MNKWNSVSEMVQELGLSTQSDNLSDLRKELRDEVAKLHPDKNGGDFKTPGDKARFYLLLSGMEFLDKEQPTALVPIKEIAGIIAAIKDSLGPSAQESTSLARTEYRRDALDQLHSAYSPPRIGSGVLAAICTGILAFGGQLKDNPILGDLVTAPDARSFLLSAFFCSGILFVVTWMLEQRAAARIEWLATEAGMKSILMRFAAGYDDRKGVPIQFSFGDFCDAISAPPNYVFTDSFQFVPILLNSLRFFQSRMNYSTCENLATVHLAELERRKIVKKVGGNPLEIIYEINPEVAGRLEKFRYSRRE